MSNLTKAFSYLIAAQVQAITLIVAAWWIGDYLNQHHPIGFSWFAITIPVGVIGVAHSFYVVIRYTLKQAKKAENQEKKPK
jgi:positive regulator of sigma E activity